MNTRERIIRNYERQVDKTFLLPEIETIKECGQIIEVPWGEDRPEFSYPIPGYQTRSGEKVSQIFLQTERQFGRAVRTSLFNQEIGSFNVYPGWPEGLALLSVTDPLGITTRLISLIDDKIYV